MSYSSSFTNFFFLKYSCFLYSYLASVKTFDVSSNSLFSLKPPIPQQTESSHLLLYIIFFTALFRCCYKWYRASLVAQAVKNLPAMQETRIWFLGWEDPLRRAWQPTPAFLPGKSHGQRSLEGYSPWGRKDLDKTEWLTHLLHFS